MNQKNSANISRIFLASKYSMQGLKYAWQEGAFRLECYLALFFIIIGFICQLNWQQNLIIICSWIFVLIIEVLNSAVEACIDRVSIEKHELSKLAKDLASFAVFLAIILCLIINAGIILSRIYIYCI